MSQTIYISGYLKKTIRGKGIVEKLNALENEIVQIPDKFHANNEWCRDYMPVKATDGTYVLFCFLPSYIVGRSSYEKTIPDQLAICHALDIPVLDDKVHDIILDGGAIEIRGKRGIISDRVFSENHAVWNKGKPYIYEQIKDLLRLDELIVVPSDPWDFTGHVDGIMRFIDETRVLINDPAGMDKRINSESKFVREKYNLWKKNFLQTLDEAGLESIPFTCTIHQNESDNSGVGEYINFLKLKDKIIMPEFAGQDKTNKAAKEILQDVFEREIVGIESTILAEEGGVINCVTWTK